MKAYLLKESLERLWTYRYEEPWCAICKVGSINAMATIATFQRLAQMLRITWMES